VTWTGFEQLLPGRVRQNGYVVNDLYRAIDSWLTLGIGPWFVLPATKQEGVVFRGKPSEPVLTIAFANSGDLQIELIQQADDAPSIYREFLDSGREGFHHLAWWAEDFGATMKLATEAGWTAIQNGDAGGVAHFCYFDLGGPMSTVIEVMELNDATRGTMDSVRAAAEDWDGTNPIRYFGEASGQQ
jgi:hypothetical protein